MVVALLQTLLSILQRELLQFEQHRNSHSPETPTSEGKPAQSIDDELANVVNDVLAETVNAGENEPQSASTSNSTI
jgi:hypothetical protein